MDRFKMKNYFIFVQIKIAKLIIDHLKASAVPNALATLLNVKDDADMTALMLSISHLDYRTIELLVESGADLNATNYGQIFIPFYDPHFAKEENAPPSIESSPGIFKVIFFFLVLLKHN